MSEERPGLHFRSLPLSPNLNHLRNEAKILKQQFDSGDSDARDFIASHLSAAPAVLKLTEAQFAIARSYGFKTWPRLKAYVESHALSPEDRAVMLLNAIFESNYPLLAELYSRREALSGLNIFVAAALGEVSVVKSMVESTPRPALLTGGPRQTQPITYAAHAPFGIWDASYRPRQQEIVQLLLKCGADPNSYAHAPGRGKQGNGRLSALYGCCRQPGNPQVAEILLQAGADPNDGESLYHASELNDTRCLELLFEAGIETEAREYCIRRALDGENPRAVGIYLKYGTNPNHLDWALFRERSIEVIRLLVEHGADVNRPSPADHWLLTGRVKGLTPVQIAQRNGDGATLNYLLQRGATDNRTPIDRLIGACAQNDPNTAEAILRQHPSIAQSLTEQDHRYLPAFARSGRLQSVEILLDAGFDIEARADDLDATALLYAASNGNLPMLDLLIGRGARLDVTHKYGGNPLDTAVYSAAYFTNPGGNYPAAVERLVQAGLPAREEHLKLAIEHELDGIADVLKTRGAVM